jgi:hypothetical protein
MAVFDQLEPIGLITVQDELSDEPLQLVKSRVVV